MRLIHHSPYTLLANGVTEIKQQRNSTERRPKGPLSACSQFGAYEAYKAYGAMAH